MSRLFASYRWRRRLVWIGLIAVVAGVATVLVIEFPNGGVAQAPVSKRKFQITPERVPKTVRLKRPALTSATAVAAVFVHTAVARTHIDKSWPLLADEIKQGMSRREWDTGNIPVPPYPAGQARWALDYSYANSVGFQIALFPRHGVKVQPEVFLIDLKAVGTGKQRRWLVKAWNPTPIDAIGTPPAGGGPASSAAQPVAPGRARLGAEWLLLPIGLLSLVLLIPFGFVLLKWRRGRAIERDYLREQESRAYSSSSRPS